MTILLTGGLGHIGSKLIPELLDLDNLIVIDSLATQRFGSIFNLKNKNKLKLITGCPEHISIYLPTLDEIFVAIIYILLFQKKHFTPRVFRVPKHVH